MRPFTKESGTTSWEWQWEMTPGVAEHREMHLTGDLLAGGAGSYDRSKLFVGDDTIEPDDLFRIVFLTDGGRLATLNSSR